jgi:O-antigen/teichoic acid export membrane protein
MRPSSRTDLLTTDQGFVSDAPEPTQDPTEIQGSIRSSVVTALPVAVSGMLANGANIIVTILLARLLSNQGYGAYAQLTGLFLVVSMPGSAIIVAVVRRTALWRTSGSHTALIGWAQRMHGRMSWLLGIWAAIVLALCVPVADLLAKPSPVAVAAMLGGAGVWVILCVDRGFLQGTRSYRPLSANLLIEGGVRTVAVLVLAVAFKLPGAALGILVAEAASAVHARRAAGVALHEATDDGMSITPPSVRRDLVIDLIAALVALALIAVLQNIDVILFGQLNPSQAGSYAAVSVMCKGLVFAAIVLGGYLLPEAAISYHEGTHALRQLAATFAMLAVPAVALLAVAVFFPEQAIKLIFGSRYLGAQAAFEPLAFAMVLFSATVLLSLYLLAHGEHWIVVLLGLGAGLAAVMIEAAHGVAVETARNDLYVQAGLLAATALGFSLAHWRTHGRASPLAALDA